MTTLAGAVADRPAARAAPVPVVRFVGLAAAAFAVLYNLSPVGYENLSTGRIAALLLSIWVTLDRQAPRMQLDWRLFVIFLPVPLVLAQFALVHDPGQLSRFAHLGLYSFLCAWLLARLSRNLQTLLSAIVVAVTIQAVLIAISFVDFEFRGWIIQTIAQGTNVSAEDLYRAPGFTGSGGSALSVVQALGVLCGGLLLRQRLRSRTAVSAIVRAMFLCTMSAALVGRTGLLMALLFTAWFLVTGAQSGRAAVTLLVLAVATGMLVVRAAEDLLPASFSAEVFADYVLGFLVTGRDASVTDLASMPIPPLGLETLMGTGLVSADVNGGNPSGHDSGFVQAYYAMGLVYAIVLYLAYAYVLLLLLSWLPKPTRWMLAIVFFAIEVKEPYLFKYSIVFVLVASHTIARSRHPTQ